MYIGVSNLLTRKVVEWMGMGVPTMPVIEMNRYTKPACRCTYIDQYMSAHVCLIVRMDICSLINVNGYVSCA